MNCWNCGATVPDGVRACLRCEAMMKPEPTGEEKGAMLEMLGSLDEDAQDALREALEQSETAEEFVTSIREDTAPPIDVVASMEFTVPGICAHMSAEQGGGVVQIPDYRG